MTGFEELDWYETPRWYDLVFDADTEREADFLEEILEVHGESPGRRVLEPACGSGRLVAELARRGWQVSGFDASDAMLEHARERLAAEGLAARLTRGRLEEVRVRGRFDLAHCLVSTFKYVLDEEGARAHLAGVARALRPGGLYVLGLHLTEYASSRMQCERWVVEEDGLRVVCTTRTWPADRRRRRERMRTRLTVTEGARVRRTETNWEFRTYGPRQLRALLRSVPELELVAVHDFHYDLDLTRELEGGRGVNDAVLVLRRRP
jgi:SAM-dependent methyltransferase